MKRTDEYLDFAELREKMADYQIKSRGIRDDRVLDAMRSVPRHRFVPEDMLYSAYDDCPLPIGHGQTISQPYIVALMTELLNPEKDDVILEVGTGSGYQAAVLSRIVKMVYTIERIPELSHSASKLLAELGYTNIQCFIGDGHNGIPEFAPFDGIIVTAAAKKLPEALLGQLKTGAKMVIPIGDSYQRLWIVTAGSEGFIKEPSIGVRFVPLMGNK